VATSASVLELGGGGSTLWWLSRGNKVVTLETEDEWALELSELVKSKGLQSSWELLKVGQLEAGNINSALSGRKFDVVINDGHGTRSDFIDELELCVSSNGIIVWDNSDRESYAESIANLTKRGWKQLEFFDISPINAYCSKTTLFLKQSIEIMGSKIDVKTVKY
jgi:predicted O-methyltransferase YrrM